MHGHGAVSSDLCGQGANRLEHLFLICIDFINKATGQGFFGSQVAAAVGQFSSQSAGHHMLDALQSAHICSNSQRSFFNIKVGIAGAEAHIGGTDHIYTAANAGTLNCRDYRHAGFFQHRKGILQVENPAPSFLGRAGWLMTFAIAYSANHTEIHAGGKVPALGAENNHAGYRLSIQSLNNSWQLRPEIGVH